MRKYTIIICAMLLIGVASNLNAQQLYGRWVVPTMVGTESNASYQLTFTDAGIEYLELPTEPSFGTAEYCYMSAGGYDENYDRQFYVVGETFCYGDNSFDWVDPPVGPAELKPEYQIIQKPNDTEKYYSFFTHLANGLDHHIGYNEIYIEDNQVNITDDFFIRGGLHGYVAFAITPEDTSPRYLYVSTGSNSTSPPNNVAGIRKWTITSNGMEDKTIIVSQNTQGFDEYDFDAYNLELKIDDNGNTVIAFIHGTENTNPSYNQIVTEIIVVNDGDPQKFELGRGRIAGIEFSTFEPNMLYASCEGENGNGGIVKVNYTNGQIVETVFSGDFERTFLQTAPDGNIYGVSNNGHSLGRILQIGANAGTFEHEDVFTFPIGETVSTFRVFDGLKYYILPENSRTWIPLGAEAFPVNVSCPGYTDGSVTIPVSGGVPPYTILSVPEITNFVWDEEEEYFYANNLWEDEYTYTITDNAQPTPNEWLGQFIIDVDYDDYTYKKHHTFDESEIFDNVTYSFAKGFTVPEDVSITFNNSTILMGPLASIIIESGTVEDTGNGIDGVNGAELTLNKTTVTNHAACNDAWQGIEVRGIRNQSQLPGENGLVYQGKLVIENESVIKNAWNAVKNRQSGNYNTSGGIIMAENSAFENNKRSIELLSYENFNPYNIDVKLPYISKFKKCTFDIDDSYIITSEFYTHVSLWNVNGIDFTGCVFSNNNTVAQQTGYGIFSIDAGYRLISYCSSGMQPCPEFAVVRCEFYNLYEGIHASNSGSSTNRIYVNDARFINNSTGVFLALVDNAIVINSYFEIAPNYLGVPNCGDEISGFGIDAQVSSGFIFENNKFFKYDSGVPDKFYTGIHVYYCPSVHDIIYNNEYTDLSFGNYAEGINRWDDDDDVNGVEYRCNENTGNALDFIVAAYAPEDAKIRNYQGLPEIASGNTFSQSQETVGHFINLGLEVVDYYYYSDDPLQVPGAPPLITPEYVNPTGYNIPENQCPDHYGGGGSIKLSSSERLNKETDYANSLADYNSVNSLYESLVDGGNTTSELLDIETATPDDMWALRSQLLGDSPYLSKEVLMTMSDRTDVFPDDAIFDILAANPDELKEGTLISYLENKEDPLPDYMISILKQLALTNTTYKTVLLNDMAKYMGNKNQATKSIIHSILSDSIVDKSDLRGWLGNFESVETDKQIISSYLEDNDTANAIALLNIIPALYELEGNELVEFNDYKDLLMTRLSWKNIGKTIYDLDSADIALLEFYADNSTGDASITAKNILSFAYGYYYCNCLSYTDSLYYKSDTYNSNKLNYNDVISIVASPNPASLWVAFDYKLISDNSVGKIKITNISGNLVAEFEVNGKQGQQLWDTRVVGSGVYIYTLISEGFSTSGKVVIK